MKKIFKQKYYPQEIVFISTQFILCLVFISMNGCSERTNGVSNESPGIFSLPHVYRFENNPKDTATLFDADNIIDASTFFINKFKFTDTIEIDNDDNRTTSFGRDYITGDSASLRKLRDTLSSDGLQVFADYKISVPFKSSSFAKAGIYYPVFVVNETNSDKFFTARDRYVSAIQEAKDKDQKWRPIESKRFDFVGNGRWGLIIHPKEFALFITAKYEGSYKTLLRVRLQIGDVIYLTTAFEGSMNENQFHLKPGSYQYEEYKNNLSVSLLRRFLGSAPLDAGKN